MKIPETESQSNEALAPQTNEHENKLSVLLANSIAGLGEALKEYPHLGQTTTHRIQELDAYSDDPVQVVCADPPDLGQDGTPLTCTKDGDSSEHFDAAVVADHDGAQCEVYSATPLHEGMTLHADHGAALRPLIEQLTEFLEGGKFVNVRLVEEVMFPSEAPVTSTVPTTGPGDEDRVAEAVRIAEMAIIQDVSYIIQPPGSDAALLAAACVKQCAKQGLRTLLLGTSNRVLDEVVVNLADHESVDIGSRIESLRRVGSHTTTLEFHLRNLVSKQPVDAGDISNARIVVANFVEAASTPAVYEGRYDVVIILDADRALIPQILFAALLAKAKVIIVGTPYQVASLPPSCQENVDRFVRPDVFTFTGMTANFEQGNRDPRLFMLRHQHRMVCEISEVLSKVSYRGQLVGVTDPLDSRYLRFFDEQPDTRITLLDTSPFEPWIGNNVDGEPEVNILSSVFALSVAASSDRLSDEEHQHSTLIATPSPGQHKLHRVAFADYGAHCRVASTLDRPLRRTFNGVVIDLGDVSGCPGSPGVFAGYTDDEVNRFLASANGAALDQVSIVGNILAIKKRWPTGSALRRYIDAIEGLHGPARPFPVQRFQTEHLYWNRVAVFGDPSMAWALVHRDVAAARNRVVWNWPGEDVGELHSGRPTDKLLLRGPAFDQTLVAVVDPGTRRTLLGQGMRIVGERTGEPSVFVDDDVVWLLSKNGEEGGPLFIRCFGRRTAGHLARSFGLNEVIVPSTPDTRADRCESHTGTR